MGRPLSPRLTADVRLRSLPPTRSADGHNRKEWYYRSLTEAFETRKADLGDKAEPLNGELRRVVDDTWPPAG